MADNYIENIALDLDNDGVVEEYEIHDKRLADNVLDYSVSDNALVINGGISGGGSSDNYSLEEQVIGTWLGGKPLYRKVVYIGFLPNKTTGFYPHGIVGLDDVITIRGVGNVPNGNRVPLPTTNPTTLNAGINIYCDDTNVVIATGQDRSPWSAYVFIEYTKTTD